MIQKLEKIVVDAGLLLMNHQNEITVTSTINGEVTTNYDIIIQDFILSKLKLEFDDYEYISEEIQRNNFDLANPTWILDPIDGTANFYRGLPEYTISLALAIGNKIQIGIVYSPVLNKLFRAEQNKGAYVNGKKISISKNSKISDSLLFLSSYKSFLNNNNENIYYNLIKTFPNSKITRSAALELCYVAEGCAEGRVFANTKLWDYAAGCLIVEEAGGKITTWDNDMVYLGSSKLIATNGLIHNELIRIINSNQV